MDQETVLFHHRSKERIKSLGEVFTPDAFVNQMLDMLATGNDIEKFWSDETNIFFEPTCGNGNFVTGILLRRLDSIFTKAKRNKYDEPALYAIANSINTLWAIDIDKKNIDESRCRAMSLVLSFWSSSTNQSYKQIIKQNKNFFAHLICAIKWHIEENEALSALSDETIAGKSAGKTALGVEWIGKNHHKPLDFELSWCEYFNHCNKENIKPLVWNRAASFIENILSNQRIRGYEEFSFVLEVLTEKSSKSA